MNTVSPDTRRKRAVKRPPRAYRQDLRARQTRANADRIVDAVVRLVKTVRRLGDITLEDIAHASGVTVRTILRRFGSRDALLEAAFAQLRREFEGLRAQTRPGDLDAAVNSLMDQYEQIGDFNVRGLEAEDQLPLVHRVLEDARQLHRDWLRHTFAPNLAGLQPNERERRITALYAATDVYLWKLLRRDLNLDRDQTHETFARLVRGVLASSIHTHSRRRC